MLRALLAAPPDRPITRDDLVASTGRAGGTVSSALEFAEAKRIVSSGALKGVPGGARFFELQNRVGYLIGVEISHNRITTGIADLSGRLLRVETSKPADDGREPPDRDAHGSLNTSAAQIHNLLSAVDAKPEHLAAVGIGLAGPVDASGLLRPMEGPDRSAMTDWLEVNAATQLRERCRFQSETSLFKERRRSWSPRFFVGNDANFAAQSTLHLARETWDGPSPLMDLIYVKWSAGIGSGVVLDGKLHAGYRGMAGEIGHLPLIDIDSDVREQCRRCGRKNCLESVASYDAMKRHEGLDELSRHEFEQDERGRKRLIETAVYIGRGIAPLVNGLNPQLVVVGGPDPALYPELIPSLEKGLAIGALEAARRDLQLRIDDNTHVAVVHGAVLQARQKFAVSYLMDRAEDLVVASD